MKILYRYGRLLCGVFLFAAAVLWGPETIVNALPSDETADSEFDFSSVESGFSDAENDDFSFEIPEEDEKSLLSFPVRGSIKQKTARQVSEKDRWTELGVSLYLISDITGRYGQLYAEGRTFYNGAYRIEDDSATTVRDSEFQFLVREAYWKNTFGSFSVSAGNIIRSWTAADILPVCDKMIVYDRSEYLFSDVEDVTLGQNIAAVDYYAGELSCGVIVVPYARYDRFNDGDHQYSITPGIELKNDDKGGCEEAVYISYRSDAYRMLAVEGLVHNRMPLINAKITESGAEFHTVYTPYFFGGFIGEYAADPFLLKTEIVYNRNVPLQSVSPEYSLPDGYIPCDRIDIMSGTDLNLGRKGTFTAEFSGEFLLKRDDSLMENRNLYTAAFAWSKSCLSDTLTVSSVCIFPGSYRNTVLRLSAEYDILQELSAKVQCTFVTIYDRKESYERMDRYDRVDFSLEYGFSMY